MRSLTLKRALDLVAATMGFVVFALPMLLIAVVVRVTAGAPVLFAQRRPGQFGRPFVIYKFRTMLERHDQRGKLLSDEQRLTRVGWFLRRTSLDELPELFNVLKGEMSLVGPRPLLMQYLDRYTREQERRHEMKPGITGWAQVNGRNSLGWEERLQLDVWYVDNWSHWLDLRIMCMTLVKALKREGISAEGQVSMDEFKGSPSSRK